MKFVDNQELKSYLNELIDKHELNLSISDLLGSIFANLEITNKDKKIKNVYLLNLK